MANLAVPIVARNAKIIIKTRAIIPVIAIEVNKPAAAASDIVTIGAEPLAIAVAFAGFKAACWAMLTICPGILVINATIAIIITGITK